MRETDPGHEMIAGLRGMVVAQQQVTNGLEGFVDQYNALRAQNKRLVDVADVCAVFLTTQRGSDAEEDALVALTYALNLCREAGDLTAPQESLKRPEDAE